MAKMLNAPIGTKYDGKNGMYFHQKFDSFRKMRADEENNIHAVAFDDEAAIKYGMDADLED
jgi:hypothetical protein